MNRASWTLFVLGLFAAPVGAQALSDSIAVRSVIEQQWQAFVDEDAEKAFALASPSVRETFGTADNFMVTVRNDYPMVYKHASSQFLDQEMHPGFSFQLVKLSLDDGEEWLVVYQMQQLQDGTWRIGGVVAVPRDEAQGFDPEVPRNSI